MLCSDAADVTRDTVSGMIEDSTGSELLSKLYTGGMNAADFAAQTLATGGASSFGNLAKGLVAVTKALGDDFVRTFIKSYGDDAVKAIAAHGDDMGKLALHSTDDAAKLLLSSSDDVGKAALSYTDDAGKTLLSSGDNMIDDWYGIIDDTVDGAAKSWDDVANSIDDVADDALAGKPNTGYNGSTINDSKKTFVNNPFDNAGNLKADVKYQTGEFNYNYETDSLGRIEVFQADDLKLTERTDRLTYNPNTPGKLPGDHAGHLAGDRFGGSPFLDNLVSQSSDINLSQYKKIENQWAKAISEGIKVQTQVNVKYQGNNSRPYRFIIDYVIDGELFSQTLIN